MNLQTTTPGDAPGEVVTRTARCLDMGDHDHDAVCFERTVTVGNLTVRLP